MFGSTSHKQRAFSADDPRYGATVQPVALLLIIGALEIIIWVWCNFQQIATTHDAVFGLLQAGTVVDSKLTPQEVLDLVNGNMDKNHRIGWTVALVTQIIFLLSAFPISRIWGQMSARSGYHPSGKGFQAHMHEITRHLSLRRAVFFLFLVGEIWTDLLYAQQSSKGWLVPLLYIIAMWAGSTLVGLDGWQRFSGAILTSFNARKFDTQHQQRYQERD